MSASVPPPGFVPPPNGSDPSPIDPPAPATPARRRRPSPRSLVAAGLGLAAGVVAIFLLFGSSSNPTVDPIAQAATVSSNAPGYRIHMTVSMTSPAFPAPIPAYGDAVVDLPDHAASMSFAIDFSSVPQAAQALGDSTLRMDMIMDGVVMYLKLPQSLVDKDPSLGDRPWIEMNLAKAAGIPGLSSLMSQSSTSDPRLMFQYLRAASGGVTVEGQQLLDGLQTTHYHAEVSLDRVAASVPASDRGAIEQALSKLRQTAGSSDVPVDVWVDGHDLIRRMAMSMSLRAASGPSVQETMVADLTDYGPQPRPTPPPTDQVTDETSRLAAGG